MNEIETRKSDARKLLHEHLHNWNDEELVRNVNLRSLNPLQHRSTNGAYSKFKAKNLIIPANKRTKCIKMTNQCESYFMNGLIGTVTAAELEDMKVVVKPFTKVNKSCHYTPAEEIENVVIRMYNNFFTDESRTIPQTFLSVRIWASSKVDSAREPTVKTENNGSEDSMINLEVAEEKGTKPWNLMTKN